MGQASPHHVDSSVGENAAFASLPKDGKSGRRSQGAAGVIVVLVLYYAGPFLRGSPSSHQLCCADFLRTAPIRQLFSCARAAGVSYLSAAVLANPKRRPASTMLTALLGAGLGLTGKPQAQAVQGGPMPEVSTTPPRPSSSTAPPPTQPHQINHRHDSCSAGEGERSPAARCPPEGRWLQTLPQGEVQR